MRSQGLARCIAAVVVMVGVAATARAQTCIAIDEARDTLSAEERGAVLMLVARQFELEGRRAATDGCEVTHRLSHIALGNSIFVTLSGPEGSREGTALGLDDLPALYSQMVRSLVTGRPMGTLGVIDRTNVTASQDLPARRVQSDTFWYARIGYGAIVGDRTFGAPAIGFGYRAEFDSVGVDLSFFNYQIDSGGGYYSSSRNAFAGSLLKLQGLYFINPHSNRSAYVGGGLSWGGTNFGDNGGRWDGEGLQGELTAGYELARATTVRMFVQGDLMLPFYNVVSETFTYRPPSAGVYTPIVTTRERYAPSFIVSVGLGWQRGNGGRRRP